MDGSAFKSSMKKVCMLIMGFNFVLVHRGGKYAQIGKEMGSFYWNFLLQCDLKAFRLTRMYYGLEQGSAATGGHHGGTISIGH